MVAPQAKSSPLPGQNQGVGTVRDVHFRANPEGTRDLLDASHDLDKRLATAEPHAIDDDRLAMPPGPWTLW